jgi:Uma2 family endonuclease
MLPQRKLVLEAEFLALPESVDKIELVDGEVIVSPSPSPWHQILLGRIFVALCEWARARSEPVTVLQAPTDVRFGAGRILQPDAFLVFARIPRDYEGPIDRVPELCVEVLSADRAHDRVTKRLLYAASGVREYWVVEPSGLIERWSSAGLAQVEEIREILTTSLLPGFSLDIAALFAE